MGPIQYAKNDGIHLAYRVVGEGDLDVLWIPGWVWDIEAAWDVPGIGAFLEDLAGVGRLIMFDKRGTGQSDRVPEHQYPSFDERLGDVLAVMDAAGSERAALVGFSEGGSQALLTAARAPDRVISVVSMGGWARLVAAPDMPGFGIPEDVLRAAIDRAIENWGSGKGVAIFAPSRRDDPLFVERWAHYERRAASPNALEAYGRMLADIDIRDALPDVKAPVLLIHSREDRMVWVEQSRYLAAHLPTARLVEVASQDHLPFISHPELVVEEIERHLVGRARRASPLRRFATVMFVDIVGSTDRAAAVGDRSWRSVLEAFERTVEKEVAGHGGEVVKSTGDGSLVVFDDPQAAVLCARKLHRAVGTLGLDVRAGLHCGQIEVRGDDVGGIAVHIAARVSDHAHGGATVVSSTVRDVLLGSSFEFSPAGMHDLKGVPGDWALFELKTG